MPFPYLKTSPVAKDVPFFTKMPTRPDSDDVLYKAGRTSHVTSARYSALRECLLFQDRSGIQIATYVHTLWPYDGNVFAEPGDSGSLIVGEHGQVIGLFIGAHDGPVTFLFYFDR